MIQKFSAIYKFTAFLMMLAMFSPFVALGAKTQLIRQKSNSKSLTEDQKILHVLDRLGFGARPGDVAAVRAVGLKKYIEEQLNPSSLDDLVAAAKVKNLEVLDMKTPDILARYPNPGALLKKLEGNNQKNNVAQNVSNNKNNVAQNSGNTLPNLTDKSRDSDKNKGANPNSDDATETAKNEQDLQQRHRERQQKLAEIYKEYDLRPANDIMKQLSASRVLRAVYSERQLQEQMVDFWTNHFNIYAGKGAAKWYLPSYDRDVIRPNALGNFKDLLIATAQSPAMLYYLDNFQSVSPNAQIGKSGNNRLQQMIQSGQTLPAQMRERLKERFNVDDQQLDARLNQMREQAKKPKKERGINENYARELMELHTLGVDGGYTQKDIQEIARCFTGWTIADPNGYRNIAASMIKGADDERANRQAKRSGVPDDIQSGEFYFNSRSHDDGEKIVLGQKINEGGIKDGLKVIDILVKSPATAKFIARELAVKFVNDNPSDELVDRVADAFHKSNGDIKMTLRAIFTSDDFYALENYRAKIKTPFELVVSSLRALDADTDASPAMLALLTKMGEPLYGYQAPTGYPDKAEDWVNTGALLERMNFAVALASDRIRGTRVDLKGFEANSKQEILSKAIDGILKGEIAPDTRSILLQQIDQPLIDPKLDAENDSGVMENAAMDVSQGGQNVRNKRKKLLPPSGNADVFKVVGLLLGSPDFQRQ